MASRFVRPASTVLKLSHGDTLTVKCRLNTGEARHLRGMQMFSTLERVAVVLAYVVDWSLADEHGKLVEIPRDKDGDIDTKAFGTVVDNLDPDDFEELYAAVDAHIKAMKAERDAEKNDQDGAKKSSAISPSPDGVAGASSGSAN